MLGREHALRLLAERLDRCTSGVAQLAEVAGEAGIGKTLLLDHFERLARGRGAEVLRGRASEFERDVPFAALIDALSGLPHGLDEAGDGTRRYALHQQVRTLLEERSRAVPVVLIIDDAHWADAATTGLLGPLIERPVSGPLLVVLAHRPRQIGSAIPPALTRASPDQAVRIPLGPLELEHAAELLRRRFRSDDLATLHTACGGNPFHLQELAKVYSPRGDGAPPMAVAAALATELAPLSAVARRLLDAAAVVGDPFEIGLAMTVAGLPATAPAPAALREAGAGAVAQAHHVEQCAAPGDQAAIAVLVAAGNQSLRGAPAIAAQWLGAAWNLVPDSERLTPESVALLRALSLALSVSGNGQRAIDQTMALVETLDADHPLHAQYALGVGAIEMMLGRLTAARWRLRSAAGRTTDPPTVEAIPILLTLASAECSLEELAAARGHVEQAVTIADSLGFPTLRGFAQPVAAWVALLSGDAPEAMTACDEAALVLDTLDTATLAHLPTVMSVLVRTEWRLGRLEAASRHIAQGTEATRGGNWPILAVTFRSSQSQIDTMQGRLERALEAAHTAVEEASLFDSAEASMWAELALSAALEPTVGAVGAVAAAERALEHSRRTGLRAGSALAGQALARALLAVELGERAIEVIHQTHGGDGLPALLPALHADSFALLASAALQARDPAAAEAWARRARAAARQAGLPLADARACEAEAELALAANPRAAAELALTGAALADGTGATLQATRLRLLAGRALAQAGERELATDVLRGTEATFATFGAGRLQAEAVRELRRLGRRVNRVGRDQLAAAALPDARQALTHRQLEVCRLAAAGQSNREIAAELFLSVKAVEAHLSAAYLKLGVRTRKELPAALRSST